MNKPLISSFPDICAGRLCFTGTRIPVYLVLELLEAGTSWEKILKSYPSLSKEHIRAALHYAAEILKNREYVAFA